MPLGPDNPLPFEIGDGPTATERVYHSLVSAVGKGGSGPAGGLRELWRHCIAEGIATAARAKDLATLQAFPPTMTVALDETERFLGLPVAETEVDRRANVWAAWIYAPDATGPNLSAALRAIDPGFALDSLPWAQASTMIPGRVFGPLPGDVGGVIFGGGQAAGTYSAIYGNFGDPFVFRVRYFLSGAQTEIPQQSLSAAIGLLNETLPFWVDFDIYNLCSGPDGDGFYLDGGPPAGPDGSSLLDMTGL